MEFSMDERLEKALEFSNYMSTLSNQKRLLHESYIDNSVHYLNGGKFNVTKELINFCNTLLTNSQTSVVLIDDNDIPVEVEDLQTFFEELLNIYFVATNEYLAKYTSIKTQRSVAGLLDI
jgi:hypothetical protein